MDILFHAATSAMLANQLGERRPRQLILAATLGVVPDVVHAAGLCAGIRVYPLAHSLLLNLPICLAVCLTLNWRIAWGGLLHLAIDTFTHAYSTRDLLYPFSRSKLFAGIDWYQGRGLLLWAALWLLLLTCCAWRWHGRRREARRSAS